MADYNEQYRDLKNKLVSLKLMAKARNTPDMAGVLTECDLLLKMLDDRYSDEKPFGIIETRLNRLE